MLAVPPDDEVVDDAPLWRVEGRHHEVVCFVVADERGVALCVECGDELLVA